MNMHEFSSPLLFAFDSVAPNTQINGWKIMYIKINEYLQSPFLESQSPKSEQASVELATMRLLSAR